MRDVVELYPGCRLFKRNDSYYWDNIKWVYEKNKPLPAGIRNMQIYWDFGSQKRITDLEMDIIYGFTFYFDEKGKVREIKLGFFLTEP